jgi:hypothetical protein
MRNFRDASCINPKTTQTRTRPENAFEVCWTWYRACVEQSQGGSLGAIDPTVPVFADHHWRPESKPLISDYIADFRKAGEFALKGMASRKVLFDLYIASHAPWERACHFIGIGEFTAARWLEEIKQRVGEELMNRKIYPPKEYFKEYSR